MKTRFLKTIIKFDIMGYLERKKLFKEVEERRARPLVTYVTSLRPGMSGNMAGDAIRPFIDQLECIARNEKSIDFLIISNGGDPITALRMMGLLRERFKNVSVLLPYVAYSAATIMSLGADEIVMHQYSNLGPVDPQMTVSHLDANGKTENIRFGAEDIVNFIEFIKKDLGVSDQQHIMSAMQPLFTQVGALSIGSTKRSQRLSLALSEKMLGSHIDDPEKVSAIAKALNSSYYHHGYVVGRKEAKEVGLPIAHPDSELENLMWRVWLDYEAEMKCNEEFNILKEIMNDPQSAAIINAVPIVDIPANVPEPMRQNAFVNVLKQVGVTKCDAITRKNLVASIEGVSLAKAYYNELKIRYWRDVAMNINFNVTQVGSGWAEYR